MIEVASARPLHSFPLLRHNIRSLPHFFHMDLDDVFNAYIQDNELDTTLMPGNVDPAFEKELAFFPPSDDVRLLHTRIVYL